MDRRSATLSFPGEHAILYLYPGSQRPAPRLTPHLLAASLQVPRSPDSHQIHTSWELGTGVGWEL
jgi:hypothetical protein